MTLYMLFLLSKISSPHFLPNKSLLAGEGSHVPDHPWLIIPGTAVQSSLGPGTFPQLLFVFCEISIFEDRSPSPALCPTVTECSSNCDCLIRYKLCILGYSEAQRGYCILLRIPSLETEDVHLSVLLM